MNNPPHILVIEPNSSIREFVCMALSDEGYTVTATDNENASIPLVTDFHPDLVILDIQIQNDDDQRFLQTYRARYPLTPIVGWGTSRDAERRAKALHVTDYLEKPFNLDDLFSVLNRNLH